MSASRRLRGVRRAEARDIPGIIALCRKVYPSSPPWTETQLETHQLVFPEGQLVAVDEDETVVGMAASLIILWDDYDALGTWRDFTAGGHFTNHNPTHGRTLYGAEIMVDPMWQGHGVGSHLYRARQHLCERLGLLRIRAGARLPGYAEVSQTLSSFEYVLAVVSGRRRDPTLSFQLARGFHVFDVVHGYLQNDPESLGWAALIQWINPAVATPEDYGVSDPRLAAYMPRVAA
jgi:GNAT superfamily N-acetyltransferase